MADEIIMCEDELSLTYKQAVIAGLNHHAFQKKGLGDTNGSFSLVIIDHDDTLLAGLQAYHYYGCCHIDLLYVKENIRGKGYGSRLLHKAEEIASERHCLFMSLNTMDFEARPFYEKYGYAVDFVREGFEKGAVMYGMRKTIAERK